MSPPIKKGWSMPEQNEFAGEMITEQKQVENSKVAGKNGNVGKISRQAEEPEGREMEKRSREIHNLELETEDFIENGANFDENESNFLRQSPLEPKSPNWSSFVDNTPTEEFTTQNQKSQDVGFWEGEVVKELSVEEQIKRNRYYDEDEDEE